MPILSMHKGRARNTLPQWHNSRDVLFLGSFDALTLRRIQEQFESCGQHDFLLSERWENQVLFDNWSHTDVVTGRVKKNARGAMELQLLGGRNPKLVSDIRAVFGAGCLGPEELVLDSYAHDIRVTSTQEWPLTMRLEVVKVLVELLGQEKSTTSLRSLQLQGYSMDCECFGMLNEAVNRCGFLQRFAIKVHLTDVGICETDWEDVKSWITLTSSHFTEVRYAVFNKTGRSPPNAFLDNDEMDLDSTDNNISETVLLDDDAVVVDYVRI